MPDLRDIIGQKFNRLTAIKLCNERIRGRAAWVFGCECGNEVVIASSPVIEGKTKSCGCLNNEKRAEKSKLGAAAMKIKSEKIPIRDRRIRTYYGRYKHNAKKKGKVFNLSLQEFEEIINKPCTYCGGIYDKQIWVKISGSIRVSGVDRIDSSIGYTPDNCVPCCKYCNYAKRDLSIEEFREQIIKRYNHFILKS